MQFTSVYPQSIKGKFRSIKNWLSFILCTIYYGASWLTWQRPYPLPNQAILLDLPARKAYFFGIVIWPDELYFITLLLICSALGLFIATALYGRIWCGFTCPHTVFTDLFIKIENFFQGDRNSRLRLGIAPWNKEKFLKIALTHLTFIAVSFSFAFGLICYFYGATALAQDLLAMNVSPIATIWLIGLMTSTYLFAGFVREKVCTYMCPYGRFQSAMLEKYSKVITYLSFRGEPRGKESKGDCIDCAKCVHVCPMGIDIRDGLQMRCIGCGLCVDACNSVMSKINKPLNLIDYCSQDEVDAMQSRKKSSYSKLNAKTVLFSIVFVIVLGGLLAALFMREKVDISIIRSRQALYTIMPDGQVRNIYLLKVFNRDVEDKNLQLKITSTIPVKFKVQNETTTYVNEYSFTLGLDEEKELEVFVFISPEQAVSSETIINFQIIDSVSNIEYLGKESFFIRAK